MYVGTYVCTYIQSMYDRLRVPVADLGPLAKRHTRGIHIPNESQTRNDVSRSMQVEKKENQGIACAVHANMCTN